jgi:chaperonin cofactor prefoldin
MPEDLEKRVKELEDRVTTLENMPVGITKRGVKKLLDELETKLRKEFGEQKTS